MMVWFHGHWQRESCRLLTSSLGKFAHALDGFGGGLCISRHVYKTSTYRALEYPHHHHHFRSSLYYFRYFTLRQKSSGLLLFSTSFATQQSLRLTLNIRFSTITTTTTTSLTLSILRNRQHAFLKHRPSLRRDFARRAYHAGSG